MDSFGDIRVNVPAEYFDAFCRIVNTGLQRAKLEQDEKENLNAWWEVEKSLISEET